MTLSCLRVASPPPPPHMVILKSVLVSLPTPREGNGDWDADGMGTLMRTARVSLCYLCTASGLGHTLDCCWDWFVYSCNHPPPPPAHHRTCPGGGDRHLGAVPQGVGGDRGALGGRFQGAIGYHGNSKEAAELSAHF